jgi:hypothetical protein
MNKFTFVKEEFAWNKEGGKVEKNMNFNETAPAANWRNTYNAVIVANLQR